MEIELIVDARRLNNESVVSIAAETSSPFIIFCRTQKRIAERVHYSLASASRFICFFRFSLRSRVTDRKSMERGRCTVTFGILQG